MIAIGKVKIKAIFLGFLVDAVGSLVGGGVLVLVWAIMKVSQGIPLQELQNYPITSDYALLTLSIIFGFGFTLLGWYVAGRIAKESQVLHGGIVSTLSLILGIIFSPKFTTWFNIIGFLGTVPVGMLGGYLAKQKM